MRRPGPTAAPPLRRLAVWGSAWTVAGYAASQALRLGSNLVLTRLLAPEAFGLMLLVNTFLLGLHMFSDFGVGPSIIRSRRGDDPAFLNTAWTIQVVRGLGVAVVLAAVAWPAAAFYQAPPLAGLLVVCGLTAVFEGLGSTALSTRNRDLELGRVTAINLGSQCAGLVVMIAIAAAHPTVWALAAGALVGAGAKAALSHAVLGGPSNRFHWDREAAAEIGRFGRWVFLGSGLSFLWASVDRLVLGRCMTKDELGVYSVALVLSQPVLLLVQMVSGRVLFALYARLQGADDYRRKVYRLRRLVLAAAVPVSAGLVVAGPAVVGLLYTPDYREAGWMLRVLAAGTIIPILDETLRPVILARGDSRRHLILMAARLALTAAAMAVGGWVAGVPGVVVGYAVAPALTYPLGVALAYRRYGVWMPGLDAAAVAGAAGLIGLGLAVVG